MKRFCAAITIMTLTAMPLGAYDGGPLNDAGGLTGDIAGSHDHPLVTRYPGSRIVDYQQQDYAQYKAPVGPSNFGAEMERKTVEGKVTRIFYAAPEKRSALEIYRNYASALKKAGFKSVYEGGQDQIGNGFGSMLYSDLGGSACLTTIDDKDPQRYLFARLPRGKASTWISFFITRTVASKDLCPAAVYFEQVIVEEKQMDSGLVIVSAAEMAKAIEETGHIAIYGIHFDTDKSTLKPESAPTLREIAKLLKEHVSLKLNVIGHTDSVGSFDHNMSLSRNRAQATVKELVEKYQINPGRLAPYGVGPLAPVETNRTEQGRAKNRRVELTEK